MVHDGDWYNELGRMGDAPADEESAALFAELQQLNPELKGNAYFDAASGVWVRARPRSNLARPPLP